jgi:hypothetical protein
MLGLCGCDVNGKPIPGKARKYDPIAQLPSVMKFVKGEPYLLNLTALYVHPDGTINFKAHNVGDGYTLVTYEFVRKRVIPDKPDKNEDEYQETPSELYPYEKVLVYLYRPYLTEGDTGTDQFNRGMDMTVIPILDPLAEERLEIPPVDFREIWTRAKTLGVPADNVATIIYDREGYFFTINYTEYNLKFTEKGEYTAK